MRRNATPKAVVYSQKAFALEMKLISRFSLRVLEEEMVNRVLW
jgi:hypothetical protein